MEGVVNTFQAVYFRAVDGTEPVRAFIDGLDPKRRATLLRQLDRLNDLSDAMPHLPFPHSSQVDGELRELRCHMGSEHYRVLYHRSERLIVLLHAFPKTTGKAAGFRDQGRTEALGRFQGTHERSASQAATGCGT